MVVASLSDRYRQIHQAQRQTLDSLLLVGVGGCRLARGLAGEILTTQGTDLLPCRPVGGGLDDDLIATIGLLLAVGRPGVETEGPCRHRHACPVVLYKSVVAHDIDTRHGIAVESLLTVAERQLAITGRHTDAGRFLLGENAVGGKLGRQIVVDGGRGPGLPHPRLVGIVGRERPLRDEGFALATRILTDTTRLVVVGLRPKAEKNQGQQGP